MFMVEIIYASPENDLQYLNNRRPNPQIILTIASGPGKLKSPLKDFIYQFMI